MRWRAILVFVLAGVLGVLPASATLQQDYLNIYLKINDAEHLEKQGDFRGALEDFKDCYQKLAKIHQSNPEWESALVLHRMDDCKAKILDLQPKADAQQSVVAVPPVGTPGIDNGAGVTPGDSDQVAALRQQLQAVREDLTIIKQKYADSQSQLEAYRTQLETVNQQLVALKSQQSSDNKMGELLAKNKDLSDKLAEAEKDLDVYRNNPKSRLAQAEVEIKNLQGELAESQAANKAYQDTTTTLKQQLDQANADLVAANEKLNAAGPGTPEYLALKHDNEIMRAILTRELQEQAHRDMAKKLVEEEFDTMKLKSTMLQEHLDEATTPMTPPSNDEERQLLARLLPSSPDVTPPPPAAPNTFSASAGPAPASSGDTNTAPAVATAPTPSADTNVAAPTPPATNSLANATPPAVAPDASTNPAPVQIVTGGDTPPANPAPTPAPDATTNATPAPPASNPDVAVTTNNPAPANAPDPNNAPIPPTTVPGVAAAAVTNAAPAVNTPPVPSETKSTIPPAQTVVTNQTIQNTTPPDNTPDPTAISKTARLPDDMRETAQEAADLFKNQKYDESAAKYQSIIDKYPESLYAWSNLGVVRFQQGKFDEALKALQQAVKLSPTDAFSYSNLGIVYYQLNQFENAIDALNAAKALDPNDPKTHNYLGCACSQKGWQEVAEKEFRKAIELDPNFGDAHFNLALVYATQKPPALELARREYKRALELGIAQDARLEKLLDGTASNAQANSTSQP
jgi:tetratricopeptide (TPR) repeat protein